MRQTHRPPEIEIHDTGLISETARARARFWQYPKEGPWSVLVHTPLGEVEVACRNNRIVIGEPRKIVRR